ncbi:hypothetical protein FPOAC2_05095 [Fusarium poae]
MIVVEEKRIDGQHHLDLTPMSSLLTTGLQDSRYMHQTQDTPSNFLRTCKLCCHIFPESRSQAFARKFGSGTIFNSASRVSGLPLYFSISPHQDRCLTGSISSSILSTITRQRQLDMNDFSDETTTMDILHWPTRY